MAITKPIRRLVIMKQKRFYSYALATSLLISSFGGLVNVSAAIVILEVAQKQKVFS